MKDCHIQIDVKSRLQKKGPQNKTITSHIKRRVSHGNKQAFSQFLSLEELNLDPTQFQFFSFMSILFSCFDLFLFFPKHLPKSY